MAIEYEGKAISAVEQVNTDAENFTLKCVDIDKNINKIQS